MHRRVHPAIAVAIVLMVAVALGLGSPGAPLKLALITAGYARINSVGNLS